MNLSSLLYRGRHYLAGVLIVALPLWHLGIGPKLPEAGVARSMIPTAVLALSAARSRRRRRDRPELVEASASYSRYSSDLQHEVSIESQQRDCNDRATRDGQPVAPQLQFKDEAISGTKLERDGLNELLDAAEAGRFNRLYFFSLSRLARESVIGMSLLKRLVNVFKIRVISVSEGFDSAQPGWEVLAQVLFMQHERYIKELSANSFRGQSLNITKNYSNGDYCFGYCGEPIPGTEAGRRGRKALPRMAYAIDPITSVFVRQIFHWFVHERRAIRWIVRRLNELNAPKDHRATTPKWTHACVRTVLTSRKYVGDWPWGERKNNRDADTGDVFQELRAPEEAEKYRRQMPELRLIDDETFQKAQEFLAENRRRAAMGRNEDGEFVPGRNGGDNRLGSHLLSGLIVCGTCGRKLHVGGAARKYLVCPAYVQGV